MKTKEQQVEELENEFLNIYSCGIDRKDQMNFIDSRLKIVNQKAKLLKEDIEKDLYYWINHRSPCLERSEGIKYCQNLIQRLNKIIGEEKKE